MKNADTKEVPMPVLAKNDYYIDGATVVMALSGGQEICFFDLDDLELLAPHRWHATHASQNDSFYAQTNLRLEGGGHRLYKMHRMIMGLDFGDKRQVDHLHHQTLDNRRSQMEIKSHRRNSQNKKRPGASIHPGVCWDKRRQKWMAKTQVDYRCHFIGYFDVEKDAAEAYRLYCQDLT